MVILGVVVLIGPGADTERVEPEREDSSAAVAATTTPVASAEVPIAIVERVDGARDFSEIVDAGNGYLAIRAQGDDGLPSLHRSLGGERWRTLRVTGDPLIDPELGDVATFGPLTATPEGWAVMATRRVGAVTTVGIDRLVSRDALDWRRDPDFDWELSGEQTTVLEHDASTVVLLERERTGSDQLLELLDSALATELAGRPCAANAVGSTLLVELCAGGGERISASDLVEPERFEDLSRCAVELAARSRGWSSIVVIIDLATNAIVRHDISDVSFVGSALTDDAVVIIDTAGSPAVASGATCAGSLDAIAATPPRAIFLSATQGRRDVELPVVDVAEYLPTAWVGEGESLIWWDGQTLWSLAPTVEPSLLLTRPDDIPPGRVALLSDDGTSLVLQDWDVLYEATLDGAASVWREVVLDEPLPNANLFEVDARNIFLTNVVSLFRVVSP